MPYFPLGWQKEGLISSAHTVQFVQLTETPKLWISDLISKGLHSCLPSFQRLRDRSLLWNINRSHVGRGGKLSISPSWNVNKLLPGERRIFLYPRVSFLGLLFNHSLTQVARFFFSQKALTTMQECEKFVGSCFMIYRRDISEIVKFVCGQCVRQKY